ncbi:hypothetical protein M0811_06290 [Anaeramoeba ignava]|uniref:Transmembrane protein n=1 Tax=Anaeramoeba ignava TaxID=1746090 RepID=A0A9Q0LPR3_ANAIG|nr:hypothetical protein M0811_06290 [Anaeramoeba ignava]
MKNSETLPVKMQEVYVSLIDSEEGFVYFADQDASTNSHLFKFEIESFQLLSFLDLGVYNVYCGIIDTENKLAYFGSHLNQAKIVKVDLKKFKILDTLSLSGISNLFSAQIDIVNQKGYFISDYTSPNVVKIDLLSFVQEATLTISDMNRWGSVIDVTRGLLYIFTDYFTSSNPRIEKIELSTFSHINTLVLNSSQDHPFCGVIDSQSAFMYVGIDSQPMKIIKIDLNSFQEVNSLNCSKNQYGSYGSVIDSQNHLAYFLAYSGFLVRINLSDFTIIDTLSFGSNSFGYSISIDLERNCSFIGFKESQVGKIDLTLFNQIIKKTSPDFRYPEMLLIDDLQQVGYLGFELSGLLAKIDLNSLQILDYLETGDTSDGIYYGGIDNQNQYAYFLRFYGLIIIKLSLTNFSIIEVKELIGTNQGNNYTQAFAFDKLNGLFYLAFVSNEENFILKLDIPNYEIMDSVHVEESLIELLLDSSGNNLYAFVGGLGSYSLMKFQLPNMNQFELLNLSNFGIIDTMILDLNHQFIYFGNVMCPSFSQFNQPKLISDSCWPEVCRISISTLKVLDCTKIDSSIESIDDTFLDSTHNYGFFSGDIWNQEKNQYSTKIAQIELSSNQLVSYSQLDDYSTILFSELDSKTGNAYTCPSEQYPVPFIQLEITIPSPTPIPPSPFPSLSQKIIFPNFLLILFFFFLLNSIL